MFISLDGIDGAGKSSQIQQLREYLESQGESVVCVRDPGGTPTGEAIRELLLSSELTMHRRCEAMLFMAARCQLVESIIRPALQAGKTVISDRYLLANVVYQSIGSDLQPDDLWRVGEWSTGGLRPDLTLLLDMPASSAMQRIDRPADRMESRGIEYLEAVRMGFLVQLPRSSARTAIIDADQPIAAVQQQIVEALRAACQEP